MLLKTVAARGPERSMQPQSSFVQQSQAGRYCILTIIMMATFASAASLVI
jgi:hypothetical protein